MWTQLSRQKWKSKSKTIGAGCEFGSFLEASDNCEARQQEVGTDLVLCNLITCRARGQSQRFGRIKATPHKFWAQPIHIITIPRLL